MILAWTLMLILAVIIGVPTLYLMGLTVAACLRAGSSSGGTEDGGTVLVIVPAHNEERGLRRTLESVAECLAPGLELRVVVIADNCLDETAAVARLCDARVFVRNDPLAPGKGQALNWLITTQRGLVEAADYCAVIDADTVVDGRFFLEAVRALRASGELVVQGFYGVLNTDEGRRPRLMAAALAVFHHLRPLGRCAVGGTAGLKGNGMVFHRSVLLQYGWPAFSNVEDVEFTIHLALDGVRVWYVPTACVYGEMPTGRAAASTQRARWEGGRAGVVRRYLPVLCRAFLRRPSRLVLDVILDLLTPPLGLLVVLQAVLLIVAVFFGGGVFVWLGAAAMVVSAVYVACGLVLHREPFRVWVALAAAPVYVAWKGLVYARLVVFGGGAVWRRTPRS